MCTWSVVSGRGELLLNKRYAAYGENAEIASFNFIRIRLLGAHANSISILYEFCRHRNEACADAPVWCDRIIIKINYFATFMSGIINETLCLLNKRRFYISIIFTFFIGEINFVSVCHPEYVVCTVCVQIDKRNQIEIKRCWPKLMNIFPGRLNVKRQSNQWRYNGRNVILMTKKLGYDSSILIMANGSKRHE